MLRTVFRSLGLVCAAFALFTIAGGHWAVLQTVAWAGMLHDYTQSAGSISRAVAQTFDGQHPCGLCRQIAAAKANERQDKSAASSLKDAAKVKAKLADGTLRPRAPSVTPLVLAWAATPLGSSRAEPPPPPPPRCGVRAA